MLGRVMYGTNREEVAGRSRKSLCAAQHTSLDASRRRNFTGPPDAGQPESRQRHRTTQAQPTTQMASEVPAHEIVVAQTPEERQQCIDVVCNPISTVAYSSV